MVGDEQIPRSEPARRGGLSNIDVDTLEAAHPGEGVAELVAMHALIGGLPSSPTPSAARPPTSSSRPCRLRRPLQARERRLIAIDGAESSCDACSWLS